MRSPLWPGLINALPKAVLVMPMVVHWLVSALRYRSLSLPSAANPDIETGGLVGESKLAYLEQVARSLSPWLAATVAVAAGPDALDASLEGMAGAALRFPVIAKPDVGWCGFGVRLVEDRAALAGYIAGFPAGATFLLQEYLGDGGEAGLFYVRWPGAPRGAVTSLTVREPPTIMGNGRETLAALIAGNRRLRGRSGLYRELDRVPAVGHAAALSVVWSHRTGGNYVDRSIDITPELTAQVDAIARSMGPLHIARFDVRFMDHDALAAGRFKVIEINGAGSEAIEWFDSRKGFFEAYAGVLHKQRLVFAVAADNRRRGVKPCGWLALLRAFRRQRALIARYPSSN